MGVSWDVSMNQASEQEFLRRMRAARHLGHRDHPEDIVQQAELAPYVDRSRAAIELWEKNGLPKIDREEKRSKIIRGLCELTGVSPAFFTINLERVVDLSRGLHDSADELRRAIEGDAVLQDLEEAATKLEQAIADAPPPRPKTRRTQSPSPPKR